MLRLGIAGSGAMTRDALPVLKKCGYELSALCGTSRSRETVEALCQQYQIPMSFTGYDDLLAQPTVETVYVAVPNHLHFDFARRALKAGKHVILEKPFTSNLREAEILVKLANDKGLFLFEAISTRYLPNYAKIQEWLPRIGTVKIATCNYSQYSSRYDAFRVGGTPPVFDPAKSGGALMDLNVYNVHFLLGLFGPPERVDYHANLERGVDVSGVLTLGYDGFQAVAVGAKDCAAPCSCVIQGVKGYIQQLGPANTGGRVVLHLNDGTEETFDEPLAHRAELEFRFFRSEISRGDPTLCHQKLAESLAVMDVLTQARRTAGIRFPADDLS